MTIEFLDIEAARAAALDWPDVYFSPEYGAVVEESDGGRWEIAVGLGGRILSPYMVRPIPAEIAGEEGLFDTISPYGYCGTYVADDVPRADVAAFRRELRGAMTERGVVSEFQRLGGLVPGIHAVTEADPDADVIDFSESVEVMLEPDEETYWTRAQGRHRTSVRKARKTDHTWEEEVAPLDQLLEGGAFRTLYDGTMTRVSARPYYFFADRYYELLAGGLGDDLRLARVRDADGDVVASALFMRWGRRLHYHLAGSQPHAARAGANNLLLDGMIRWGFAHDIASLHLGGGLSRGDALFKFKAQFGGRLLPFWLMRTVLDPVRYDALVARRAAATDRTAEALRESGWFPAYRA